MGVAGLHCVEGARVEGRKGSTCGTKVLCPGNEVSMFLGLVGAIPNSGGCRWGLGSYDCGRFLIAVEPGKHDVTRRCSNCSARIRGCTKASRERLSTAKMRHGGPRWRWVPKISTTPIDSRSQSCSKVEPSYPTHNQNQSLSPGTGSAPPPRNLVDHFATIGTRPI